MTILHIITLCLAQKVGCLLAFCIMLPHSLLFFVKQHTMLESIVSLFLTTSKVTFPNLPPAQGYASPPRKMVLPQIDHNYTVGVIYAYICIECQSSILSHTVPELLNNLIWNCKGCIGKSIGPVQHRFTIPSLLVSAT